MSSAGHIQDMISRMKANEAMKNSRRKTYQKIREKLRYAYEDEGRFTYIDKKNTEGRTWKNKISYPGRSENGANESMGTDLFSDFSDFSILLCIYHVQIYSIIFRILFAV